MAEQEKDLADWMASVEERLKGLFTMAGSRPPLDRIDGDLTVGGSITIEDLGRLLLEGGGSVLVNDGQGRGLFYVGGFQETVPGTPQGYGAFLQRLDGSFALHFSDDSASEAVQRVKWYDRSSNAMLMEDTSGKGLSWPLLPLHPWRGDSRTWSGTASGSFTILAGARGQKHSPRVYAEVLYAATAADTTGELQVMCNGVQIGSTVAVSGTAVGTAAFGPTATPELAVTAGLDLTVEARRTAGTGEVKAELKYSNAWPS